eukprot:TRINITY_DN24101_c0_g1_i1.p1 TRINITY_DN24101_c0_g1~~TRINITY_DN24101_c0_g1_i1.p1  ORF type:complete len:233 (+),score=25.56 TRINITY_DN24101_c0_g1_i1:47-700(+)
MDSLYDVLGVASHAGFDELRRAYKRRVLVHHPDKGGNASSFQLLHLAFETLSSPMRRKSYDEHTRLYKDSAPSTVARRRRPSSRRRNSHDVQPKEGGMAGRRKGHLGKRLLGASVPPKKNDFGGQRPRSLLLRALRKLHRLLAAQPAELRRENVNKFSPLLKEELAAFMAQQKSLVATSKKSSPMHQNARVATSKRSSRIQVRAAVAAGQSRLWLCR